MQVFGGKPNGEGCKHTRPMWHTHYIYARATRVFCPVKTPFAANAPPQWCNTAALCVFSKKGKDVNIFHAKVFNSLQTYNKMRAYLCARATKRPSAKRGAATRCYDSVRAVYPLRGSGFCVGRTDFPPSRNRKTALPQVFRPSAGGVYPVADKSAATSRIVHNFMRNVAKYYAHYAIFICITRASCNIICIFAA